MEIREIKLFTVKDCAKFLQVSERTVRSMIANKQFCKAKRIGKQLRFMAEDFLSWLENSEDIVTDYDDKKNQKFIKDLEKTIK